MGSLGPTVNVPLLTSVSLPDGSSWKTTAGDYVTTILPSGPTYPANACTDNAGNITAWTLPTLGRMEWTWQKNYFPTGSTTKPHLQTNPAVATRGMRNADGTMQGAWGYGFGPGYPAALTSAEHTTTVTDPLGHKTVNYFSTSLDASYTGWSLDDYSLPFTRNTTLNVAPGVDLNLSRQVFNAGGTLLRSEYVLYERDPVFASGPPDIYNTNRRPVRSRTVYNDDGGTYGGVVNSGFDGLGHYRTQTTEGTSPAPNVAHPVRQLQSRAGDLHDQPGGQQRLRLLPLPGERRLGDRGSFLRVHVGGGRHGADRPLLPAGLRSGHPQAGPPARRGGAERPGPDQRLRRLGAGDRDERELLWR